MQGCTLFAIATRFRIKIHSTWHPFHFISVRFVSFQKFVQAIPIHFHFQLTPFPFIIFICFVGPTTFHFVFAYAFVYIPNCFTPLVRKYQCNIPILCCPPGGCAWVALRASGPHPSARAFRCGRSFPREDAVSRFCFEYQYMYR